MFGVGLGLGQGEYQVQSEAKGKGSRSAGAKYCNNIPTHTAGVEPGRAGRRGIRHCAIVQGRGPAGNPRKYGEGMTPELNRPPRADRR